MDARLQTLVNEYKKKSNAAMKKGFKKAVDSVVGNPTEWPKPSLDMIVPDITLQEDIAGKVAAEPKKYGLKNKEEYAVLAAMRGEIIRRVRPNLTKTTRKSSEKKMSKRGSLRKKRKATKKNKPSKRSKASNKSKSSKKTRRRTRRRRY